MAEIEVHLVANDDPVIEGAAPSDEPLLVAMDEPAGIDVDALRHDGAFTGTIQAATAGVIRDMNIEAAPIWDMQNFGHLIEGMVIWEDEATELPQQSASSSAAASSDTSPVDDHDAP